MPNRKSKIRNQKSPRAFTMTEMILVMTIIVVLLALTLKVVGKVRAAGQRTRSTAVIQNIANAIGAYQLQYHAYPGVLSNTEIIRSNGAIVSVANADGGTVQVTSCENLFLALTGGLEKVAGAPDFVQYNKIRIGTGPRALGILNGKQYPPLLEGAPYTDVSANASTTDATGHFKDPDGFSATDSLIPEFLDGYQADPMPVLYMRANIGKSGIATDNLAASPAQYDVSELYPYTQSLGGGSRHGLRALGLDTDPILGSGANTARPYLRSTTTSGARNADAFVLIGAGPDRIYGTADDITSFGDVIP